MEISFKKRWRSLFKSFENRSKDFQLISQSLKAESKQYPFDINAQAFKDAPQNFEKIANARKTTFRVIKKSLTSFFVPSR